jgi:hypothetical protein
MRANGSRVDDGARQYIGVPFFVTFAIVFICASARRTARTSDSFPSN